MKKTARISLWVAGACGLLLAVAGPAAAQAPHAPLGGDGIYGGDTDINVWSAVNCSPRGAVCANGAVNSGNVTHAENVEIGGNASHSGNPDNVNGSPSSANESHGASSKSDNDFQIVGRGGDQLM